MNDKQIDAAKKAADTNAGENDEQKKIENKRIALKIPTPADYSSKSSRDALYKLNKNNAEKVENQKAQDNPNYALDKESERKKKTGLSVPSGFKKGGRVKKGGMALVHTGEKVLTKSQASKDSRGKRIACKR